MAWVGRFLSQARRWAWALVLVAVAAVVVWLRVASPVRVRVAHVDRGSVTQEAFGRGTVESQREAAVGFDLAGRLSEVLVDEGDRVTLGQELARLETNQADADLRSARTGVGAARASLHRLAAEEERARAQLATAEREVARTQAPFDAGAQTVSTRRDDRSAARGASRARSRARAAIGGDARHRRRRQRRRAAQGHGAARDAPRALRRPRDAQAPRAGRYRLDRRDGPPDRRHRAGRRARLDRRDGLAPARRRTRPAPSRSPAEDRPSRAG